MAKKFFTGRRSLTTIRQKKDAVDELKHPTFAGLFDLAEIEHSQGTRLSLP